MPIWRPEPEAAVIVGEAVILDPPGDGTATRVEPVQDAIREMTDRYRQPRFTFDPWASGEMVAQWIEDELLDVQVVEHSQKPVPMAKASERTAALIAEGRLRHPGGDLTGHVLNAAAKTVGEGFRFVKPPRRESGKIDALIALAMAVSTLEQKPKRAALAFLGLTAGLFAPIPVG